MGVVRDSGLEAKASTLILILRSLSCLLQQDRVPVLQS